METDELKKYKWVMGPNATDWEPARVGPEPFSVWVIGHDKPLPRCDYRIGVAMSPDLAAEALRLRDEVERLTEALTPSCDTKAAYMGEIHCDCPTENWKHFVPWTSIKEIMAMIRARAALQEKSK